MNIKAKISLGVAAAVIAAITPLMAVAGWYPQRELRKWEGDSTPGFDHVQFNSFYNTPGYGNETEFFDGKQAASTTYQDNINVTVGQEITLRTYVHNNASPDLNTVPDGAGGFKGVAKNAKVKIGLPSAVGTKMNAVSEISASNAAPVGVFDTVNFTSANGTPFRLSYVAGSAYASTRSNARMALNDSIVTSGALIGETTPNGEVPGCFGNDQFVVVKVKVEAAPLSIVKTVGIPKQTFVEQVEAKDGDRLYFKVDFKNDGPAVQNGVVLTDKLPEQLSVIPGTVKLYNDLFKDGKVVSDTALFTPNGQPVGDYAAGTNGYILYQVTVKPNTTGTLTNVACVRSTEIPYDTCDDAKIITQRKPEPQCPAGYPVGDARCTPVIPPPSTPTTTKLPETGIESGLGAIAGMTGLSTMAHVYRKNRKQKSAVAINKSR